MKTLLMTKERASQFHGKDLELSCWLFAVTFREKSNMGWLIQKLHSNCSTVVVRSCFGVCSITIGLRTTVHEICLLYKTYLVHFCSV